MIRLKGRAMPLTEKQRLQQAQLMHGTHRNTTSEDHAEAQVEVLAIGLQNYVPKDCDVWSAAEKLHSEICGLSRHEDRLKAIVAALRGPR